MTITIAFPLPPRELHPNGRPGWRAKAGAKKRYRRECGNVAALARIEHGLTPLHSAEIGLRYFLRTAHRHDPDNLIAWAKSLCDSLQDARLLDDDRHVTWLPPIQETDRDDPRVEVTLRGL